MKQDKEKIIEDVIKEDRLKGCKPIFVTEKLNEVYLTEVSKETVRKLMIEKGYRIKRSKKKYAYRVRRTRRNYYGEMIQFDGSYHRWIGSDEEEYCLLVAIDDATGKIVKMTIGDNEGYESVARFWMEYVLKNGVPRSIYLDKYATYKVNNHKKATDTSKLRTNFDKSMNKLGCSIISANTHRQNEGLREQTKRYKIDGYINGYLMG